MAVEDDELPRVKANFLATITRLIGLAGLSMIPAMVSWCDAHTRSIDTARTTKNVAVVTANERVTNALAYDELVSRLARIEARLDTLEKPKPKPKLSTVKVPDAVFGRAPPVLHQRPAPPRDIVRKVEEQVLKGDPAAISQAPVAPAPALAPTPTPAATPTPTRTPIPTRIPISTPPTPTPTPTPQHVLRDAGSPTAP